MRYARTWFLALFACSAYPACTQEASSVDNDFGVKEQGNAQTAGDAQGAGEGVEAFHRPLRDGNIPNPETLNVGEFFEQHRFALPAPECELDLCLQASLARKNTLVSDKPSTMLMLGLNSAVDPSSLSGAPRHIALAIDTSQAMEGAALQDVQRALTNLSKTLKSKDRVTLVAIGPEAKYLLSAQPREKLVQDTALTAVGELNLYDGLRKAFDALQNERVPNERRILIAAMASDPGAGIVDQNRLRKLTQSYAELGHDFHAIAIGQKLNQQRVREMARAAGGHFHFLESPRGLETLLRSPQAISKVTLAKDIDIRIELASGYKFRASYGAKVQSKGESHVTLRVPSFDLVAQAGTSADASPAQKVFVLELEPTERGSRVGDLSFSYLNGTPQEEEKEKESDKDPEEERIQSQKKLISGPSSQNDAYFENEAARRAFGLVSLYTVFARSLKLLENDDFAQALLLMDRLETGLQAWLQNSAPESAIEEERGYLSLLRNIVKAQVKQSASPDAPVVDPIIEPGVSQ